MRLSKLVLGDIGDSIELDKLRHHGEDILRYVDDRLHLLCEQYMFDKKFLQPYLTKMSISLILYGDTKTPSIKYNIYCENYGTVESLLNEYCELIFSEIVGFTESSMDCDDWGSARVSSLCKDSFLFDLKYKYNFNIENFYRPEDIKIIDKDTIAVAYFLSRKIAFLRRQERNNQFELDYWIQTAGNVHCIDFSEQKDILYVSQRNPACVYRIESKKGVFSDKASHIYCAYDDDNSVYSTNGVGNRKRDNLIVYSSNTNSISYLNFCVADKLQYQIELPKQNKVTFADSLSFLTNDILSVSIACYPKGSHILLLFPDDQGQYDLSRQQCIYLQNSVTSPHSCFLKNNKLFVVSEQNTTQIYDFSQPTRCASHPEVEILISQPESIIGHYQGTKAIALNDSEVFLSTTSGGVYVYDYLMDRTVTSKT